MKYKKHPLRLFLFASLLLCLLTGLTGIARSPRQVDAAPVYQTTCNSTLAEWTFDPTPSSATNPAPSTANVTASASQSGVGGVGYQTTGSHSGNAWSGNSWSQTSTISSYFEFDVSTVGYGGISMSLWASRPNSGPSNVSIQYSTDGTAFTQFNIYSVSTSVAQISIDLSSIKDLDNNSNAKFRIYGIDATGSTGTLRIDDVTFTGCPVVVIDSMIPNPTNDATTVTWHALVNGSYEIRLGATDCTDGTLLESGSYTTSPATVISPIAGTNLAIGTNSIRVCVTDALSSTNFAVGTVDKETTPPTVTIDQASGQADPASAAPINFTVVFSEAVTGFDAADVNLSASTATGTLIATISGTGPTYTIGVTGMTGNGDVIASIPANVVKDLAGNDNTASTSNDNTVTFTSISPPSLTNIVISEFRTAGNDEFIEIYNPTNNWVDITGWKINGSNNSGTEQTRVTISSPTILRPGQYYLAASRSSFTIGTSTITANTTYGTGISDDGGIALLNSSNQIVDEVGMSAGSAYQEGTTLPQLTDAARSYERLNGEPLGSCIDTNDNRDDFKNVTPSPHNSSTRVLCDGTAGPSLISTATLITADTPDPSLINGNVSVSVRVTGTSLSPSGTKVYITGANTNCSLTLNASGTGSCNVKFTSTGTKTITATFIGDNTHSSSSDTESHTVTTTSTFRTPTPSRIPTQPPPPPLVAINEFVPRPGHDWNNDGEVNVRDEYIEILNHGTINVNLSGYSLDDEANIGSQPYRLPAVTIRPGERIVFYGSETGLLLSDGGDGVRLLKPNGQLADAYNYTLARYSDQSYCRLPDNGGLDDWNQNCYPTPGLQNSLSSGFVSSPNGANQELLCPIADTLPQDFVIAECAPYGTNIWRREFWDSTGWYDEKIIPGIESRWDVYAD